MQNRRAFLRLLGASLGGTVLSSCGGSKGVLDGGGGSVSPPTGGTSGTPLPNSYGFTPVMTTHASGSSRSRGRDDNPLNLDYVVPGSPMLNGQGQIIFQGGQGSGGNGLNQLQLDLGRGRAPRVVDARVLARQGQVLDGRVVDTIYTPDTNRQGSIVVRVQPKDEAPRLYVREGPDAPLEAILGLLDQLGEFQAGGALGTTDLTDSGDILLVSSYYKPDATVTTQGLFYLPRGSVAGASVIAGVDQAPPQVDAQLESFGLVDMNEAGNYVFEASVRRSIGGRVIEGDARQPLMIAGYGHIRQSISRARLLSAGARLGASRAESEGETLFAPRVSSDGAVMRTVSLSEGHSQLFFREMLIAETGQLSPGGRVIKGVWPGVVNGVAGLCYYQLSCEGAEELCVSNGTDHNTLLTTGDMIEGKRVAGFLFGFCRECADSNGNMCAQAWFTDGTTSIIVGFPV